MRVAAHLMQLRLAYAYAARENTALHAGKDLAVSPPTSPPGLIRKADASAFRLGRLCSHLSRHVERRALPATVLRMKSCGRVRTFLSFANAKERSFRDCIIQ